MFLSIIDLVQFKILNYVKYKCSLMFYISCILSLDLTGLTQNLEFHCLKNKVWLAGGMVFFKVKHRKFQGLCQNMHLTYVTNYTFCYFCSNVNQFQ